MHPSRIRIKHTVVRNKDELPSSIEHGTLYFGFEDGTITGNLGNGGLRQFGGGSSGSVQPPIDNLTSHRPDLALSANQGRILNEKIQALGSGGPGTPPSDPTLLWIEI